MKRETWDALEKQLNWPGAQAHLRVDDYDITLLVARLDMRMVICVYVNGWMKGKWLMTDCEERRRFLRPRVRAPKPYTDKQVRLLGKKWCA